MILDLPAIRSAQDWNTDVVPVPEWGPKEAAETPVVRVRSLTCDQRSRMFRWMDRQKSGEQLPFTWTALCCAMGIIGPNGETVVPENEADVIGKKHPEVVERIAEKILSLSKITTTEREALKKKSEMTTPSDGSCGSAPESTPDSASTGEHSDAA